MAVRAIVAVLLGLIAVWGASGQAWPSAWNAPQGDGILITDYTFSGGTRYFDGHGALATAEAYRKQELYGYLEYGITDRLMAVIKPDLSAISAMTSDGTTHRYAGLGTSEIGAQLQILAYGPAVLAAGAGFRLPGRTSESNPALIGNTSHDVDLWISGGTSHVISGLPVFVDIDGGYRFRSSGAPGEWHADATFGMRPWPRVLLLLQSFSTIADGSGTAWFPRSSYSKLGLGVVYDLSATWSVEIGVFETIAGRDALRERGVKAGFWHRF